MIPDDLHELLIRQKLTVATAESLTGGMIASTLAARSGASAYFRGSIVAYNLAAKVELLGVDAAIAEACDCVSAEVADQMALGAERRFKTDCTIAVTGYAERAAELGVPFAHYTVLCKGKRTSGIVYGVGLVRNQMRRLVTITTINKLTELVIAQ